MNRFAERSLCIATVFALALPGCASKPDAAPERQTGLSADSTTVATGEGDDQAAPVAEAEVATEEAYDKEVPAEPSPATTAPGRFLAKERRKAAAPVATGRIGYADKGGSALIARPAHPTGTEHYTNYGKNPFVDTAKDHLSTFAVDVDTASYAIARRKILAGVVPPPAAVRVEEFVNYFRYDYAGPKDGAPFAVHMDMAPSPFSANRQLLRVGVQGKEVSLRDRKPAHLVFLVDVSGSMHGPDRIELAKRSLRILVDNLKEDDTVALVTYAGSTRVVLEPTGMQHKARILSAIEDLTAGGSTAMASGIELAYGLAVRNVRSDAVSRVIVLSDGDANVGNTSHRDILATIAGKVKEGVTLSTIGFGMGNYKDTMMEQLANKGNGNNYYIDSLSEAKKVFQEQLGGTLEVIAKDVKLQVDFDPEVVKSYRLIGYENRDVADADFRNDKVDAGEIGAGHQVTALYELVLAKKGASPATVRVRAKQPRGDRASERSYRFDMSRAHDRFADAPADFRFATAVMAAAELLRQSEHARGWKLQRIIDIARATAGDDPTRAEFVTLLGGVRPLESELALAR